tara:strand:- start:6597 stop:7139 length:543 start_codon:yes stop_codon:yes gene_type:complete
MKQLDLFLPEVKHISDKRIDVSEIGIDFGDRGQRRIDLTRASFFLRSIPKGRYFLYPTGGQHPLPSYKDKGNIFPYVYSAIADKNLEPSTSRSVYPSVKLGYTQNYVSYYVHRLFAMAFIPNDLPLDTYNVDHVNEDKLDYSLSNLRWVTVSENMSAIKNRAKSGEKKVYSSEGRYETSS